VQPHPLATPLYLILTFLSFLLFIASPGIALQSVTFTPPFLLVLVSNYLRIEVCWKFLKFSMLEIIDSLSVKVVDF